MVVLLQPHSFFAPTQISGLIVWLRADAITGLADTDAVTTWTDESGAGNSPTQASSSKKPLYRTNIYNGRPCVRFDGVDDGLQAANYSSALSQPTTMFVVGNNSTTGTGYYFVDGGTSGRNALGAIGDAANMEIYGGSIIGAAQSYPTGLHLWTCLFSGSSSVMRKDGASFATGGVGSNMMTRLTVGIDYDESAGSLTGDVCEILIYTGDKTSEFAQVEAYLKSKWGL